MELKNLINERLENFFANKKSIKFRKGEMIIRAETEPSGVYLLRSGYVKMFSVFEDGRELTLNIFKPGSYFPMMWALGGITNNYYFGAITGTDVQMATKKDMLDFIGSDNEALMDLTRRISVGVNGLLTNMEHFLSGDAYHRVVAAMYLSARRFGSTIGGKRIKVDLPLTHQDVASLAGITRETASVSLGRLQAENLIIRKGQFYEIVDLEKLKEESEVFWGDDGVAGATI